MMRMNNIQMTTKVNKTKLLTTLKSNLEKHSQIVQEARKGYLEKALKALQNRMKDLQNGKLVTLSFTLSPPVDYSEIYKNSISMLEWNTAEVIELRADEFRQLVRDEWDWTDTFLHSNSRYSATAQSWLNEQTGGAMVQPASPEE